MQKCDIVALKICPRLKKLFYQVSLCKYKGTHFVYLRLNEMPANLRLQLPPMIVDSFFPSDLILFKYVGERPEGRRVE